MFAKTKRDFWACQEADQIFIKCAYDLIPLLMFHSSDEHYQSVMQTTVLLGIAWFIFDNGQY